jgi:hypothetical protein
MRCPLPVDWLEYLEGAPSDTLALHLRECRPCQLLAEELRRDLPLRRQLRVPRIPLADSWPRWHEAKPSSPVFGDIWWNAKSVGGSDYNPTARVPLLVLSDLWEERDRSWLEVVPLSTDIENATSLDLVLHRSDTDLQVPWRALLRYQTVSERDELDGRIGKLTETGRAVVQDVLAGHASEERFGSPIGGPDDPRVRIPEEIHNSVRLLGRAYARMLEQDDVAQRPVRVLSLPMRRTIGSAIVTESLGFAAASTAEEDRPWAVEIPERGRLRGRIQYQYRDDELFFVIDEVAEEQRGLPSPVWIAFWSDRLPSPVTSPPFRPAVGEHVPLGRDYGILPREISRLELRLSDES